MQRKDARRGVYAKVGAAGGASVLSPERVDDAVVDFDEGRKRSFDDVDVDLFNYW